MLQVTFFLNDQEGEALKKLAESKFRDPKSQAAFIVCRELEHQRLLQIKSGEELAHLALEDGIGKVILVGLYLYIEKLKGALKPFAEVSKSLREMMSPYEKGMDLDDLTIASDWLLEAERVLSLQETE